MHAVRVTAYFISDIAYPPYCQLVIDVPTTSKRRELTRDQRLQVYIFELMVYIQSTRCI